MMARESVKASALVLWHRVRIVLIGLFMALALVGCGPECTLRSSNGTCYELGASSWTLEQIEANEILAAQVYASATSRSLCPDPARLFDLLEGVIVRAVPGYVQCGGVQAIGCQIGDYLPVTDRGCPRGSAVAHELAHWWQARLEGRTDGGKGHGDRSPFREINAATFENQRACEVSP